MIDKKIHYCWFGGKPLPKNVKKCIKSWKKYCPDYEIIKWDESNFDVNCCQFTKDAYKNKAWAFVSDFARLKIIYENGGIYLDTDVELVRNIDELLNRKCYLPLSQGQLNGIVSTGLGFGAEKKSNVVLEMLKVYENTKFDNINRNKITCPYLNKVALDKYGIRFSNSIEEYDNGNITVYPPKYFDPISPGTTENLLCKDTFSIHHYSATWTGKGNTLKRKIIDKIGLEKINKIKKILKK